MKACEAVQYSDQMQCARCGLAWDTNDQDPPECRPRPVPPAAPPKPDESAKEYGRRTLSRLLKEIRGQALRFR